MRYKVTLPSLRDLESNNFDIPSSPTSNTDQTADMTLELHPVDESDFAEFVRIQTEAFSGGGMTKLLKPSPLPSDFHQKSADKHLNSHREEPDVTFLKVIDTALNGKMIAGAKWRINKEERTEAQIQRQLPVPGVDEEGRPAAQEFYNYLNRVRREFMGTKPFALLHILVTDPEHHRRGAGAMLLNWGTEIADTAQLPAFLESTTAGRPLYSRFGFVPKEEQVWDLSRFGLQGTDMTTVMIREPLSYAPN